MVFLCATCIDQRPDSTLHLTTINATSLATNMSLARTLHAQPAVDAAAAATTSAPPAPRLYRHALESVFSFCRVRELATMFCVSKEWAAAVQSMRPLGAHWRHEVYNDDSDDEGSEHADDESFTQRLCASRLPRHIGSLDLGWSISVDDLPLLCARMPHLHRLCCRFSPPWPTIVFPPRLRSLSVSFHSETGSCCPGPFSEELHRQFDAAIRTIAKLPLLESLSLEAEQAQRCDLTPLLKTPALRSLKLDLSHSVRTSPALIDTLRRIGSRLRFLSFDTYSSDVLMRLLQPPHDLKLEEFQMGCLSSRFSEAIVHLPSLTTLDARLDTDDTDFFLSLPNLRSLDLSTASFKALELNTERILQSLHALIQLTDLRVSGGFQIGDNPICITSAQLAAALAHMPLLTRLDLTHVVLDSLRFLSSAPSRGRSSSSICLMPSRGYPYPSWCTSMRCLRSRSCEWSRRSTNPWTNPCTRRPIPSCCCRP
jgi:hypothetical protein